MRSPIVGARAITSHLLAVRVRWITGTGTIIAMVIGFVTHGWWRLSNKMMRLINHNLEMAHVDETK